MIICRITGDLLGLDEMGNVIIRMGSNMESKPMSMYVYHFTRDGEYVGAENVSAKQNNSTEFNQRLANSYEQCQVWVYASKWHTIPAAGLAYARFEPENDNNVPMCVRMAEILRND